MGSRGKVQIWRCSGFISLKQVKKKLKNWKLCLLFSISLSYSRRFCCSGNIFPLQSTAAGSSTFFMSHAAKTMRLCDFLLPAAVEVQCWQIRVGQRGGSSLCLSDLLKCKQHWGLSSYWPSLGCTSAGFSTTCFTFQSVCTQSDGSGSTFPSL